MQTEEEAGRNSSVSMAEGGTKNQNVTEMTDYKSGSMKPVLLYLMCMCYECNSGHLLCDLCVLFLFYKVFIEPFPTLPVLQYWKLWP